jgi:hypothetical protein
MDIELKLGDKVWMHYGPSTLIVGHIIDYSPDFALIGLSPLPYDEYKCMSLSQKAGCPISWCETKYCHYRCHITYNDLKKMDEAAKEPKLGFGGVFANV